jgi:hypothetical protein
MTLCCQDIPRLNAVLELSVLLLLLVNVGMGWSIISNSSAEVSLPLPLLPNRAYLDEVLSTLDGPYSSAYKYLANTNISIPKLFWITAKNVSGYPKEERLQKKHRFWKVNVVDDYYMDLFMEKVFVNTSVLWAYKAINPLLGACRADIWR